MPAPRSLLRRLLATALLAWLVAGCFVLASATPAQACSCARATPRDHVKSADAVFVGTVSRPAKTGSSLRYEVAVDRVYKGEVRAGTVSLTTGAQQSACGLGRLPADRRYMFFAGAAGSTYRSGTCEGTAPATKELIGRVERLLGEGRPVTGEPEPPPEPPGEPPSARLQAVGDAEPPSLARTAAPGAALVLVGLLGLMLLRRRRE